MIVTFIEVTKSKLRVPSASSVKMGRSQMTKEMNRLRGEAYVKLFTKLSNRIIFLGHSFKVAVYQWAL
jgi:hypothetical protein